jgi:hypothetical protein
MEATPPARQTQAPHPRAQDITFGVEVECFLPRGAVQVGGHHAGRELGGEFPPGWNAQRDGSLSTRLPNYEGVEVVSPVLRGRQGLEEVKVVAELLGRMNARVNPTCGFHVHVGVVSAAGNDYDEVADWVRRLLNLTAHHEMAFYGATGSRRRQNSRYCASLRQGTWGRKKEVLKKKMTAEALRLEAAGVDRYQLLNVQNVFGATRTVEFRAFSGTVEALKMTAYVQMALAAATRALERDTTFDAPVTGYAGTSAAGAMKRFFYLMGWTRGRKDYYKPTCTVEGWVDDMGALRPVKRELMRLARKFDASLPAGR